MAFEENLTVLLVDDDVPLLGILAKDFRNKGGFDVITATSTNEALAQLINARPELVILDLYLKDGLDGLVCIQKMREHGYKGLIFMLTGETMPEVLEQVIKAGVDDYITKGEFRSLADEIKRLLGLHFESILSGRPLNRISEGGYFRSRGLRQDEIGFLAKYAALGCPREKNFSSMTGLDASYVWKTMKSIRDKLGIDSTPKLARIVTMVEFMGRRGI